MSNEKSWSPKKDPWMPPDYDDVVVYAIRALALGKANAHQQGVAWKWLQYVTGASDEFADLSFRPGAEGQIATTFAEGKRFVGLQIRKMLHPALTPKVLPEPATEKRKSRKSDDSRR
jgi:hypothetical protein